MKVIILNNGKEDINLRKLSFEDLKYLSISHKADEIKLEVSFTGENIDDLINFLNNCRPCFIDRLEQLRINEKLKQESEEREKWRKIINNYRRFIS